VKVTRFHHVSVNCHDASLDDMTAFYGGLFGLADTIELQQDPEHV
jgi:hypothetical protein